MFTRLEIKNFQSHKNTTIDFDKNINSICGETDNGKSAVIRAIKWIVENRPLGIESSNSYWNEKFSEDMSAKLYLDNDVWIERIKNKTLNGYRYSNGKEVITLEAVGKDVPQVITDLLKLNDVNFQFQMDAPYLLSMTSGDASKYLNKIIHLDTIDSTLATADSDKRSLNAEKKIVEKDIANYEKEIEKLNWIDDANAIQKKINVYDNVITDKETVINNLKNSIDDYEKYNSKIVDVTKFEELINEIESIEIRDISDFEKSIDDYINYSSRVFDSQKFEDLINKIESIEIKDTTLLEKSINDYTNAVQSRKESVMKMHDLQKQLPKVCPLCGSVLGE